MLDKFAISTDQVAMMIADAREDAIVAERERIVELLQTLRKQAQEKNLSTMVNINAVITLIKGKNK